MSTHENRARAAAQIGATEANHALGFKADFRDFSLAAAILHNLRIPRVRLLTNNPRKVRALSDGGIEVVERFPCEIVPTAHSLAYLKTKKQKIGHALSPEIPDPGNVTPGIKAQL
jgi:GTP cyclohydrolase II